MRAVSDSPSFERWISMDRTINREKTIIRTSIIGIAANVFLAAFKAVVGLISHSIAITLDAVNNISDAASSVITIVGTKLAGKAADKKHPLGHGRVEFITAALISVIILYAGVTSLVESIKKIITPETPDYSGAALIIVGVAVAVKILLGLFVRKRGRAVNSDSLVNSGTDALLDSVISASTLAAAAVYLIWGVSLEAWLGAIISLIIIKSGVDMLRSTISQILGERVESELSQAIKKTICSVDGVEGAYDLILHSYGPDKWQGSVHIEVPDTLTAGELDTMERDIQERVYLENHVILTGIGVYAVNTTDDEAKKARSAVTHAVMSHDYVLQIHGFYFDAEKKHIRFDVIIDFAAPDRRAVYCEVLDDVQKLYPDYTLIVAMDSDVSD